MQEKPEIIPLLLLRGRTNLRREYSKKALANLAKNLRDRNFETLYVMDVDGVERNRPQLDIVQTLSDDFSIMYEAGPKRGVNVIDLVIAGADMVYMNTYSMVSLDEIEVALSFTENIGLKIDWDEGIQGLGEGIEDRSLEDVLRGAIRQGMRDFVVPAEIIDRSAPEISGYDLTLRAIADSPGDESISDDRIKSLIVNHELLGEREREE